MAEEKLVPKLRFNGFDDEWQSHKLGEISDVTKLAGFEFTEYVNYSDKGNIIALRGLNVKNNKLDLTDVKYIDNSDFTKLNRSKLYLGDLLFTYVGTIGEVALISEDDKYYLAPNVCRIRCNNEVNPDLLKFYFNTIIIKKEILKYVTKSSQPALSMENIRKFKIKLPNIVEQEKIANFLISVDNKIELIEKKYEAYVNFKKYLMQQIFAQKLRFADDEDWKTVKLKTVGEINTGNTPSTKVKEYYSPEKYLWVTPSDISSKYIANTEKKLSEEGAKKGRFVKKDSVLVTCIASIGKNCIITQDGYFNQQINSITPNKDYDSEFIYYLICNNAERMKKYAGITATPILNKKSFENMKFEFPSLNEQKQIKMILSNVDNKIFMLENMIDETQKFKKGLLQQMFV